MIRASRPDDVPRLFAIWRAAVTATHDFLAADDLAAIAAMVERDYLPAAAFLVAVDGEDRPLGFLGRTGRHVDALFVDPAAHGRGLGTRLLNAAAAEAGVPLTADVNEQNGAATAFYRARGFRETGRSETDDQGRPYPLLHMARAG